MRVAILFSIALAFSILAICQTQPSFRADSNLVAIPVSVTDSQNRFVLGLRKEDFRVFDDGVEQPTAHFSSEDVPLSIGSGVRYQRQHGL